jgi:hypothetical protein
MRLKTLQRRAADAGPGIVRFTRLGGAAALLALLGGPAVAADGNDLNHLMGPLQLQLSQSNVERERSRSYEVKPPEPQQWSVQIGGLYTTRNVETAGWAPNVEVNYSPIDRLQLHAMMPFAYDNFGNRGTNYGPGDFEIGARYRLIDDDPQGWTPSVAVYPLINFPTGDVNERLGTGRTHAFLPVWFSKAFDEWIPFGGGGYWINPGPGNKDWGFAALGVVRVVSEELSLTFDTFHATASKVGLKDQTGVDVGVRYNLTANHHFIVTVGTGIENREKTNQFTSFVAYALTF